MLLCRVSGLTGYVETSGAIPPTTRHYISEYLTAQTQDCGNIKSQKNEDSITDKTN